MTIEELRKEAEKLGYVVVKKQVSRYKPATYNKCKDCKHWKGEKRSIGRECLHPTKEFMNSETAHYKYSSQKACKLFEEDKDE